MRVVMVSFAVLQWQRLPGLRREAYAHDQLGTVQRVEQTLSQWLVAIQTVSENYYTPTVED